MTKKRWKIVLFLLGSVIIMGSGFAFAVDSQADVRHINQNKAIVIAHRGGAAYAPENTLEAVKHSIDNKAEMVELDVRQLRDGTFILLHDSNFARTTGLDLNVWDAECEDIKELDASVFAPSEFTQEKVPTLNEVLDYAHNKIYVMLDVKVNEKEEDVAKQLLETIDNEIKNQCVIGSSNLKFLEHIKGMDGKLVTVYIAKNMGKKEYELDYIDGFSINVDYLTKEMVQQIHNLDKPTYVWTVNSKQQMKRVAEWGVDGIVTDNVPLAQNFLQ